MSSLQPYHQPHVSRAFAKSEQVPLLQRHPVAALVPVPGFFQPVVLNMLLLVQFLVAHENFPQSCAPQVELHLHTSSFLVSMKRRSTLTFSMRSVNASDLSTIPHSGVSFNSILGGLTCTNVLCHIWTPAVLGWSERPIRTGDCSIWLRVCGALPPHPSRSPA